VNSVVNPYIGSGKGQKEQIAEMFDSIAPRYDFLNHFLSFGIDKLWRRRAIRLIKPFKPSEILDVATGTGDLAIEALKTGARKITGIDISEEMLALGRSKIEALGLNCSITLKRGDSEKLEFENAVFDAVTVAFGVRNFEDLGRGLYEIHRVLRPGGTFCVLEFSKPRIFPFKQLYNFYSHFILPFIGRLISNDHSAYRYLPESVRKFPDGQDFILCLANAGFTGIKEYRQTFGIATIYIGFKESVSS
jgi:demethylmenaquinone methyltransferase/2-methoxy-6-polyprenyl-1,4-benzoquinol methylase